MSFYLVAFDNTRVSNDKVAFNSWFEETVKWEAELDYDTPQNLINNQLKLFFHALIQEYPPMNGELAPSDEDIDNNPDLEVKMTDYSIGTDIIYAAFAWSQSDAAYECFKRLAKKYAIGFYNCSNQIFEIDYNI